MKKLVFSIILALAIVIGSHHFAITAHDINQRSISSTSLPSSLYHYEMNLDFYVAQRLLENKSIAEIESSIDKQIQNAQTCVEHIFKKRENITIKITKKDIHWLADEEFLRVGKASLIPDLDNNNNPVEYPAGNQTDEFKVFVGDFDSNHAANVHNSNTMKTIEKNDILKLYFELSSINHELVNFVFLYGNDERKYTSENLEKFKTLLNKQSITEEKISKRIDNVESPEYKKVVSDLKEFKLSNVVKITPNVLNETFEEDTNTLIHELFHAFARFDDLYTNPQNTQPNLMGAYHGGNTCILNESQIEQMINYRNKATH